MSENLLARRLRSGQSAVGGWCVTPSALAAEAMAVDGVDYVCVDLQHGLIGFDAMAPMLMALGHTSATPIVRVLPGDPALIGKVLDAGAEGVIVPMVESAETARAAVAACRYAPSGTRSLGPVRAGMYLNREGHRSAEAEVLCLVMVETTAGVDAVEEIAASGVDGIYIGPADLALSLGVTPAVDPVEDVHVAAIERVRSACREAGIFCGIHTSGGAQARRHLDEGFAMVTLATDLVLLRGALAQNLSVARGEPDRPLGGPYG